MGGGTIKQKSADRPARTLSLRSHLVLLVIGALLPVVVFSAFIVRQLAADQRASAERRLVRSAHDLTSLIDREMTATIRALGTLARSERLESGDLDSYRTQLTRALQNQPAWHALILAAPDGRQLINTGFRTGGSLPPINEPDSFREVLRTRRPIIGNLAVGKPGGQLAFPVRVPVIYGRDVRYVLSAVIRPAAVADLVASQKFGDEEWTRTVVDSHGTIVARTRDPERFVGKAADPSFWVTILARDEGVTRSTTLDGQDVYTGFSRSEWLSGWTGIVVVPKDAIDGPALRYQFGLVTGGLAMLVLSATGAFALSRRVSRGIAAAAAAAESLARGQRPPPAAPSSVAEVARLNDSLRRSADLLADRERERDANLARADAARADAEAANRAKDEFLAMLGHELRNPLAPIRTGVHLLATLPPGDERADSVRQTIERQADHMAHLVDDLLDASRVARGKVELDPRPLDLRTVAGEVVADLRHEFDQARVSLDADLPDAPVPVFGDPTRLAQCLGNLLHNALKFTPPAGRVRVSLATDADAEIATLAIHDTGAGIHPDLLPRLFQPFSQGPQSPARTHGGLGLGLALVRGFVSLHHGTVSAHSEGPGKGSTFTITLPLHARAERNAAPDSPPPQLATGNSQLATARRVLIVEDLPDAARTLKLLLSLDGHDVRTAATAAAALAAAPDFTPDVVICDIGLPDMDGYELCRRLRQLPATQSARLIALTGYGQADDVARATAAGFDLHLTKPVDVPTLRGAVSAAAHGSTNVATPAVAPAHTPANFGSTGARS